VPDFTSSPGTAAIRLRGSLSDANRFRRARDRRRRAWRAAPYLAGLSLSIGLVGGIRGWSPVLPLALLGTGLCLLAAYALFSRGTRDIPDAVAAAIDREAGLDGELRSANWFATREALDAWAEFHVDRAAERVRSFNWASVYRPSTDRRAKLTTGGIAAATLLLPFVLPGLSARLPFHEEVSRRPGRIVSRTLPIAGLPVGLPKDLEALLSAAENGTLRVESPEQAAALRSLLDKLAQLHGAESLKQLARAMAPPADPAHKPSVEAVMKSLAERAQRAAENAAVPPAMRDALDNLAGDLSKAARDERAANIPRDATPAQAAQDADAVQTNPSAKADEMSIQAVRDADAGGAAAVLMVSDPNGSGSDPGTGLGGGSGAEAQQGRMADIAQALRRETVEANANSEGDDTSTDLRRKSERGQASASFTRSAPHGFDTSRASLPPAVPETRRAAIQSYFVRKQ
jgi:hypothetical protein